MTPSGPCAPMSRLFFIDPRWISAPTAANADERIHAGQRYGAAPLLNRNLVVLDNYDPTSSVKQESSRSAHGIWLDL